MLFVRVRTLVGHVGVSGVTADVDALVPSIAHGGELHSDRPTNNQALRLVANYSDLRARSAPRLVLFLSVSACCVCLNNFEYNNYHSPYSRVVVMSTTQVV